MTILTVIGTRPEAIKLGPILRVLAHHRGITSVVCLTGQHRELLSGILELFGIRPQIRLRIMKARQTPADVAARILERLDPMLVRVRPDWVFVQGDTTTAFAAGLAAFYRQIPVAHVEAGLRTSDLEEPFPEELHRQCLSRIASLHFAPTTWARNNLLRENIERRRILMTGNTGIDAVRLLRERDVIRIPAQLRVLGKEHQTLLVTVHRREHHGNALVSLCTTIRILLKRHPNLRIVFPLHPHPDVTKTVRRFLGASEHVLLLPALPYHVLLGVLQTSWGVLTDSGGIQEEAAYLGVPTMVFRQKTDRPETIEQGRALLVGTDQKRILESVQRLLTDARLYKRLSHPSMVYGNGHAAERIVQGLLHFHTRGSR